MTDKFDDPKFAGQGPSAAYAFERNRVLNAEGTPEAAHEAGIRAHLASVYGHDAKKDRNGNFIPQGIGSPGHENGNHFAGIRKYEGEDAYWRAVRAAYKHDPAHAKALGLPEPQRIGS